jgi:hypothetical protein
MAKVYVFLGVWIIGGLAIGAILVTQLMFDKYEHPLAIYAWVTAALAPGIGASVGLLEANFRARSKGIGGTPTSALLILILFSLTQVCLALGTILAEPLATMDTSDWFDWSQLWLAPLNSLIVLIVAHFSLEH